MFPPEFLARSGSCTARRGLMMQVANMQERRGLRSQEHDVPE